MLSREVKDIAHTHSLSLVLVGTYSSAAAYADVNLKFVRTQDGRIVRAHSDTLPNARDVNWRLQALAPAVR